MLSIIKDRIHNADEYQKERFSKYGDMYPYDYGQHNKRHGDLELGIPKRKYEKVVKGCKHTLQEVQEFEKAIETRRERNQRKIKQKWQEDWDRREAEQEGLTFDLLVERILLDKIKKAQEVIGHLSQEEVDGIYDRAYKKVFKEIDLIQEGKLTHEEVVGQKFQEENR